MPAYSNFNWKASNRCDMPNFNCCLVARTSSKMSSIDIMRDVGRILPLDSAKNSSRNSSKNTASTIVSQNVKNLN